MSDRPKPVDVDTLACACGRPMSRNPHPDAGSPASVMEVGPTFVCIPCTVASRHAWAQRARAYERERDDLRRALEMACNDAWSDGVGAFAHYMDEAALAPAPPTEPNE